MTTLYFLDTLAELIELTYSLGQATRKYVLPAFVAAFVAFELAFSWIQDRFPKNRKRMTAELMNEWQVIIAADPEGDEKEIADYAQYLDEMSDNELLAEYSNLSL